MSSRPSTLSAGKFRGLQSLADDGGRFKMVAVDQRPPLFRALARHGERRPEDVRDEEIASVKTLLVAGLAPHASAILVDPIWAHPDALSFIPGRVGLISTLEDYAFEERDGERYSEAIENWTVAKIKRSGAVGVKVLAYHRPDLSPAAASHQDAFVASVGEACRQHDIPFILELLLYPRSEERVDSREYARLKPERVLQSLRHFAQEHYGVDLFKLEFPADLKHTSEFAGGAFDGLSRNPAYDLAEVRNHLRDLDESCPVPWVLLSAGVRQREFTINIELAVAAGASGFLAGRAVWYEALDAYPDLPEVRAALESKSVPFLRSISALAESGRPWFEHRRFGGTPVLELGGRGWHERYPQ